MLASSGFQANIRSSKESGRSASGRRFRRSRSADIGRL